MPHKYLYENKTYKDYANTWKKHWDKENYNSAVDLLNREKKLMIEWLEMKFGTDYLEFCLDNKGDLKIERVESIFALLEEECKNWYNIDTNVNIQISDLTQNFNNLSIVSFEEIITQLNVGTTSNNYIDTNVLKVIGSGSESWENSEDLYC